MDDTTTATGSDGLPIGRGDLIQTRKNDTALGVANRQQWIVQHVTEDGTVWAVRPTATASATTPCACPPSTWPSTRTCPTPRPPTVCKALPPPSSHTILTGAMSGAAVYVGMTRGKDQNQLHIVAQNTADARAQFIDAMERDRADRGLADATRQAAEAVRGLVDDGPAKRVNTEIAALTAKAERAEARAALWQQAADALTELYAQQRDDLDHAGQARDTAAQQLERVRAEVAAPLTEHASAALAEWGDADVELRTARDRLGTVGRFGKRRATAEHNTAQTLARDAEQRLTSAWGEPPRWNETRAAWLERVTRPRIDGDPRVIDATEQHDAAARTVRKALEPDPWPRLRIYARIFGTEAVAKHRAAYLDARPHANAENAARIAKQARAEIDTLQALTPVEAVERIEQTRATEQAQRDAADRALKKRQRQLDPSHTPDRGPSDGGPSLGW